MGVLPFRKPLYVYYIYIHTWKMHRLMIPLELRSWKVAQYFTIYDELSFQKWKLCHGHPKLNPLLLISGIIPAFSQPQGSCFPTQEGLLEPTSADTQRKVENSNRLCSRWCSLYKSTVTYVQNIPYQYLPGLSFLTQTSH